MLVLTDKIKTFLALIKNGHYSSITSRFANKVGYVYIPKYPLQLYIEPNNTCNLKCPLCITGIGKLNRKARHMTFEEYKSIVDQSKRHVREIWLCNYGEPFLNKEIFKMIRYATINGIYVYTSTNGMFFTSDEVCMEVLKSGLKHLIITLDGADQETIVKYRVGANFDQMLTGYKRLINLKKKYSYTKPTIELQFIIMKHNELQKDKVRKIADSIGVDVFCEKTLGLDYNNITQAKTYLPNDLSDSRYSLNDDGTYSLKGVMSNKCNWVNSICVINSDGIVVPCCYDSQSEFVMGNVFTENLSKIWRGEKYDAFRKKLRGNRKDITICNICSEGRYVISKQTQK